MLRPQMPVAMGQVTDLLQPSLQVEQHPIPMHGAAHPQTIPTLKQA